MHRLKYFDGDVLIGNGYATSFENFDADCIALNITNPFTQGKELSYRQDKGTEFISEGIHAKGDRVVSPALQKIIDYVDNFEAQRKLTEEEEEVAAYDALPTEVKLERSYLKMWPAHKQLEAIIDKLNGDSTKFDAMNADFVSIKNA